MAFGLEEVIAESNVAIQICARAYADAVAKQDVLAAFAAAQKLAAIADAAVAVFVIVTTGVAGALAEVEERHP